MEKGKLIVIEGASDGIGKTTQFQMLKDHLEKDGNIVINHHFPTYKTYHGAPVEHYLSGDFGVPDDLSPYFIHSMYALDRAITWKSKLKDSYEKGDVILLDRYTTSSLIYQASTITDIAKRKAFLDFVEDYEYEKLGIKKPDFVIFLSADFDVITEVRQERKDNDGIENDIHERDLGFMRKVYDNALFVAKYLNWHIIKCDKAGKFRSREDIHDEIYQLINKK